MPKTPQIHLSTRASSEVQRIPLTQITEEYLLEYAGGESHTSRAKKLDIASFIQFLARYKKAKTAKDLCVADWDHTTSQNFVDTLLDRGESPATVARRLATVKHMGRILSERIPGFINPARDVKAPKVQLLKPKYLEKEEVDQVIEFAVSRKTAKPNFNRIRNETLVRLLLDTGLRADEVRNLRLSQISEDLEWISQVRTKGRRFRNVYITSEFRPYLKKYLDARSDLLRKFFPKLSTPVDSKLPLFISTFGAKPSEIESFYMSPKSVWRAVRECSKETRLHPHLLRHTYATDLLESSHDVRLVAQALGHSDVRVTMRYTERIDQELAKALEKSRKKSKPSST